MLGSLLDKTVVDSKTLQKKLALAELTAKQRLILLTLNFIPLFHFGAVIFLALFPPLPWGWRLLAATAALYLTPPILARLILALQPIEEGTIRRGSKPFFFWWSLFQSQMIFSRLPFLEELLRLIPGAYSQWLRLWGARVGKLTFWSPGTQILDRPFLSVGDDVIFGAGVRVNPHVIASNESGGFDLLLGTVRIGDRVKVGGYSLLTAGSEIAADEETRALLVLPPFSSLKNGKRLRSNRSHMGDVSL